MILGWGMKLNLKSMTIACIVIGIGWFFVGPKSMLRAVATGCCSAGLIEAFQIRPYWERGQPQRAVNRTYVVCSLAIGVICTGLALSP